MRHGEYRVYMSRVSGKVAIITGAARGIGEAIARRLVEEGAQVMLTDVLDAEGKDAAQRLGVNARFLHHDVTKEAEWVHVVSETEADFGPVSVLVNNAGVSGAAGPIDTIEEADFRRVMDINLMSVFLGMKTTLPSMRRATSGSIINVSSVAGIVGSVQSTAYSASKFAIRGLTKTVALDVSKYGIRVNSVHPGIIETPMVVGFLPVEKAEEFIRGTSPMGRLGTSEEIASMVLFLASDESSFSTGAEFIADGGYLCR